MIKSLTNFLHHSIKVDSFHLSCLHRKFRSMGYEEARHGDESRTAFRIAEKRFKLYKEKNSRGSKSKGNLHRAKSEPQVPATCLDGVIDFQKILHSKDRNLYYENIIECRIDDFDHTVYAVNNFPGFYFIPEALTIESQRHFIIESLTRYPQPPNRTNHSAMYGQVSDIWQAAQHDLFLTKTAGDVTAGSMRDADATAVNGTKETNEKNIENDENNQTNYANENENENEKEKEKEKERWRFVSEEEIKMNSGEKKFTNDDEKNTKNEKNENKMEEDMDKNRIICSKSLLRKLRWATVGIQFDWSKRAYNPTLPFCPFPQDLAELASKLALPAMQKDKVFHAQAAIINFYGPDDMLGGHVDDMEKDWSKPIVSLSLGCKGIFLLGGVSKDEPPIAMFVRSGDVLLLSGHVRRCYHAVPRIFTSEDDCDIPEALRASETSSSFLPFAHYITNSRININVREVGIPNN